MFTRLALSLAVLAVLPASAQTQPGRQPLLIIQTEPAAPPEKVGAKTVDIEVRVVGQLAETRMTLTFGNPHGRALAGDLYLPLPERATVSGYALDVAGKMVDGVVVEKHEARRIFEREIRKGIDPGLVEWTQGNVFHTRVFPIPANGTRTIRVRWVAPLDLVGNSAFYDLPLNFPDKVDLRLRVEVRAGTELPVASGKGPLSLAFSPAFVAESKVQGAPVVQAVRIEVPGVTKQPVQVERAADGTTWFAIQEVVPVPEVSAAPVRRVRLVWDASWSRAKADHAAELRLVERLLAERFSAAEVEVVVMRHVAEAPKRFAAGEGSKVVSFLSRVYYDGGTQLGALGDAARQGERPDLLLLFSDGLSTYGEESPGVLGVPTWAISSSSEAAHDALGHLAGQNGGAYFNLGRATPDAVVAAVGRPVFSLLRARADGATDLVPAGVVPVVGPSFAAGRLVGDRATVELAWGIPGQEPSVTRTYVIDRAAARDGELVGYAWAERRLSELMGSPAANADAIFALGQAHGIVTPGTSLLVLETLEQYLEYAVRPPATLPEFRAAWDAEINRRDGVLEVAVRDRLTEVAAMWADEVAWYERKFSYPKDFRYHVDSPKKSARPSLELDRAAAPAPAEMAGSAAPEAEDRPRGVAEKKEALKDSGTQDDPGGEIALRPWTPETPYVRALRAASADGRVEVYLKQREEFGTAPSFFLDVSDFFREAKDEAMALQVLSNIAELKLGEPALLRILAHRLAQLGRFDVAIRIFEEVLHLRPEEPQSYRDLALVFGRRGLEGDAKTRRSDLERALSLLADVVKRRWDRFDAIEIMALTEANRLWPHAKAAGVKDFPLDGRFVAAMELDVRIVMTWDADLTDMDLHVLEPSFEEAYYGHNLTTIGGKVSRDFTQGYGPEVYSVRRAMPGTYKVKTKFFGSSAAQLQGAVTLQVDVFTNWGRPTEKRQSMTLRLTENKEEFIVGEVRF